MDILPHTPPPLQPIPASPVGTEKGKGNDKTKRKKSTTVRRRPKKVTSNEGHDREGATTSVGTEEEAKTKKKKKKKKRRLWTKRVRRREPSLSPDSELFDKNGVRLQFRYFPLSNE